MSFILKKNNKMPTKHEIAPLKLVPNLFCFAGYNFGWVDGNSIMILEIPFFSPDAQFNGWEVGEMRPHSRDMKLVVFCQMNITI